ncbi:hypothetical protein Glove_55g52 [Diversispora epigaea]|uniref:TLDc domain-containing protein n=1 Tax=Diversispora epigaea TaxID=1348612 RepID=A0A397JNJ0_9GLOM|nr:hypothetical protein Glove_55g52 [Diversispora epigaea]
MIEKVTGTDEILGGYNPLAWDTKLEINDSFIFSLKNDNIQNSILSRQQKFTITQGEACWCDYNNCTCYEKSIRTTNERFSIVDYEAFKIVKKH